MNKCHLTPKLWLPALFGLLALPCFAQRMNERTIPLDNSQTKVQLWEQEQASGDVVTYYQIQRGDQVHQRQANYLLKLRHGDFDPLTDQTPTLAARLTSGEKQNLYLVQFVTQSLKEYRQAIKQAGGDVYFFMPNNAHVVRLPGEAKQKVADLPFVRWVGPYHPAYRLEELMLENENRGIRTPQLRYNVMLVEHTKNVKNAVAERITKLGGKVDRAHAGKFLIEATLTHDQLIAVAAYDEVLFIDRWGPMEKDMDLAREIGGANFLETMEGLTGEGVRAEVIDSGFNTSHVDFGNRPLIEHTAVGTDSHGASTSGIVFGDGTGNPAARGLLPNGQGIIAAWDQVSTGQPRYDHTGELVQAPYFAVFQTASVGSPRTTEYTTISADTDAALFDFDIVHLQSQSNAGNRDSRPQAWAKNIISGGGIRHRNTLDRADDAWDGGASIGPASDGRIKPDLASFYDSIFTVTTGGTTSYTQGFGGTSGATPIIAGYTGLLFEMWHKGLLGNNPDPNATVFENRCHMTTAKALLINTAYRYPFSGQSADLTRVHQGWGMPDLENLYNLRDRLIIVDETEVLPNMGTATFTANVLPGEAELKATMIFADPAGSPSASQHSINDLSLKVTSPGGVVYWGNNGLLDGNFSTPNGTANTVDTVENVFIENPEAGAWSIEVIATEVNQDSHVETPAIDADFALVVSGAVSGPGFGFGGTPTSQEICAPANAELELEFTQILGFDENITLTAENLPTGAMASFSQNNFQPPAMATLTLSNLAAVAPGNHTIEIKATTPSQTRVILATIQLSNATPPAPLNVLPANGSVDAGLFPTVSWDASPQANSYVLEISDSSSFANTIYTHTTEELSHDVTMRLDPLTCYYWRVRGLNGCGEGEWQNAGFTTLDQPDYHTELFQSGVDIENQTLAFIPDGSGNYYRACIDSATTFPTDPSGGTALNLSDDSFQSITPAQAVNFYGTSYSTIHVGSNGYVTFTGGDTARSVSLTTHFSQPRVSMLLDDLNPAAGGQVTYKDLADRLAITFSNVPEYNTSNSNNVQVEFFHSGRIHITWLGVDTNGTVAGLSRGGGVPSDFIASDFSGNPSCSEIPLVINGGISCAFSLCLEDLNNDQMVDATDLYICVENWHSSSPPFDPNGDGRIDIMDMMTIIDAYGACSPID